MLLDLQATLEVLDQLDHQVQLVPEETMDHPERLELQEIWELQEVQGQLVNLVLLDQWVSLDHPVLWVQLEPKVRLEQ